MLAPDVLSLGSESYPSDVVDDILCGGMCMKLDWAPEVSARKERRIIICVAQIVAIIRSIWVGLRD